MSRLVDSGVQRRAGRHVFLLRFKQTLSVVPLHRLIVVQTHKTVVIFVRLPVLSAALPPPEAQCGAPGALLVLDLGAVEDVDGVGRQGELQAAQVLVHHLFAVDELAAVDLGEQRHHNGFQKE